MENKLYFYRMKNNYTLKYLSKITGISIGYICHIERGTRQNPSLNVMSKIANALDKNITDIFLQ